MEKIKTDVVVVGTGAAGLYHALHIPKELQIYEIFLYFPTYIFPFFI